MTSADQGLSSWLLLLQSRAVLADAIEQDLEREAGLPLAWFDVLIQLANAPQGRLRMQDLARCVLLSKSGLTRLVDRLTEAGLVERVSCDADRRVTFGALTGAGAAALRRALPVHARALQASFVRHLDASELRTLELLLRKVVRAHGAADLPCPSRDVVDGACGR